MLSRFLDESDGDKGEGDESDEVEDEVVTGAMELELLSSWKLVRTGVLVVIQGELKVKDAIDLVIDDASTHLATRFSAVFLARASWSSRLSASVSSSKAAISRPSLLVPKQRY